MPFPEKNPPNVPILPGPDYRYTVGNPTIGKLHFVSTIVVFYLKQLSANNLQIFKFQYFREVAVSSFSGL